MTTEPEQDNCARSLWKITVAGYGSFNFEGTEAQAEEMRRHKANWEKSPAAKLRIRDLPPEQDDRLPCPTCKASGFVLSPDEADAPSTVATVADAASEPLDDAMTRDMDRLWRVLIRDHVTEEDLSDASLGLAAGATEIRRLRARLKEVSDLLDSIDYERGDL